MLTKRYDFSVLYYACGFSKSKNIRKVMYIMMQIHTKIKFARNILLKFHA